MSYTNVRGGVLEEISFSLDSYGNCVFSKYIDSGTPINVGIHVNYILILCESDSLINVLAIDLRAVYGDATVREKAHHGYAAA